MNYTIKLELANGKTETSSYNTEAEAINAFCLESDKIGSALSAVFLSKIDNGIEEQMLSAY